MDGRGKQNTNMSWRIERLVAALVVDLLVYATKNLMYSTVIYAHCVGVIIPETILALIKCLAIIVVKMAYKYISSFYTECLFYNIL